MGTPTLISGTSRLHAGEWIYTDFVYDDYGADTVSGGQPNVVALAPTVGDARYPDGPQFAANAADIVEVRVRPAGRDLEVRVLLQTITATSTPALWVKAGAIETTITAANAVVDPWANTMTFRLANVARGNVVALAIGAGIHDGAGGLRAGVPGTAELSPTEYTTGGPTRNRLFDLAFNTRELEGRGGAWNEEAQAKALASGQLAPFTQQIDVAALRGRVDTDVPTPSGYSVRLFESRQAGLRDGVGPSFPQFRGRWQPYALWIPEGYDATQPGPLVINMHSLQVHHNQYRGGDDPVYRTYYEQIGDGLKAIVVTPLGRGPDGWYWDEGLVDTLEVWADTKRHYAFDSDRVLVTGYSMGGYGTYRLSTLMPDSFASAASIVGPPGRGVWAYPGEPPGGADSPDFTYPQLENTRHVPFWITQGALDELVPVLGVREQAERFAQLGHEHRFALHPTEDHLSFAVKDDWRREQAWFAAHARREENPHRITHKVRPQSWATFGRPDILAPLRALAAEVGARLDGAYWVGDVTVAGDGDVTGVVDLASGGIVRRWKSTVTVATAGIDGPSPYTLTGLDVVSGDEATCDTLRGTLSGVASLTIDVERAGLSDQPTLEVTTDRPVTITFVRHGVAVGTATLG